MNAKTLLGAVLIMLTAGLVGGGFYAARSLKHIKYDPETLCPAGERKAVTLILVDKTDPLTEIEQRKTREIVEKERDAALRGDRIKVKILLQREGTSDVTLDTILDLCNPGAEADPFFENPKKVRARYQKAFREPIDAALSSVSGQSTAPASPIALAIQSAFSEMAASPAGRIKLILISDLMEHGPEASAYTGTFSENSLRKLIDPAAQANLRGAEVQVILLPRVRQALQQKVAVKSWLAFLSGVTGRNPEIQRL